ncbi:hypothetical protein CNMCM6106_000345 [Aspergillus hiratsukae]|uniref:Uncharacterized protein n=1 Tax=Aspergillus hiratsukae TaxID=1194566 RepID=A0A8H6PY82_9EURO|nr:hypothetical protein CNMCM6106_000345 [Aspergillus hiratsukae]
MTTSSLFSQPAPRLSPKLLRSCGGALPLRGRGGGAAGDKGEALGMIHGTWAPLTFFICGRRGHKAWQCAQGEAAVLVIRRRMARQRARGRFAGGRGGGLALLHALYKRPCVKPELICFNHHSPAAGQPAPPPDNQHAAFAADANQQPAAAAATANQGLWGYRSHPPDIPEPLSRAPSVSPPPFSPQLGTPAVRFPPLVVPADAGNPLLPASPPTMGGELLRRPPSLPLIQSLCLDPAPRHPSSIPMIAPQPQAPVWGALANLQQEHLLIGQGRLFEYFEK